MWSQSKASLHTISHEVKSWKWTKKLQVLDISEKVEYSVADCGLKTPHPGQYCVYVGKVIKRVRHGVTPQLTKCIIIIMSTWFFPNWWWMKEAEQLQHFLLNWVYFDKIGHNFHKEVRKRLAVIPVVRNVCDDISVDDICAIKVYNRYLKFELLRSPDNVYSLRISEIPKDGRELRSLINYSSWLTPVLNGVQRKLSKSNKIPLIR